jgi:capsular polysaccharide biosynthesis protein
MELSQYLGMLVRKWWIMLLACVVTVTSAVIFSKVRPPIYRSSAVLQVIPARYEYGLILAAEQLLRQFANQIQTTNMAQQVIPIPEDFLIQIDVDRASAEEARAVASTLARDYVAYHAAETLDIDRADRVRIRILEDARYGWVHWPKTNTLALAGAVLGLLIGLVLTRGLEDLESDVLRSLEDVERHVGVPVVGSIPTAGSREGAGRSEKRRGRSVVPWSR